MRARELDATPMVPGYSGEVLSSARAAQNMTVQDVAAKLRTSAATIEALEQGRFENFASPTYARGFIRSYARFLGVDAQALITAYDRSGAGSKIPEIDPDPTSPSTHPGSTRDFPMRMVSIVVVLALLGLLAVYVWQYFQQHDLNDFSLPKWGGQTDAEAIAADPALAAALPPATPAPPPAQPLPYRYDIVEHDNNWRLPRAAVPTPAAPVTDAAADTLGSDPLAGLSEEIAAIAAAPAAVSAAELQMKISGDSWIDVYDAGGNKVYFNMARAGEKIKVSGQLPYHVRIGRAALVALNYRGSVLDISKFTRDGVARFQLTESGAAAP